MDGADPLDNLVVKHFQVPLNIVGAKQLLCHHFSLVIIDSPILCVFVF